MSIQDVRDVITTLHGAGGTYMYNLIKNVIIRELGNNTGEVGLLDLDDGAVIGDVVFTTDSYTIKPIFFPGGDIGRLAVSGTINDLAMMGADPAALSLAMVIEEGFPLRDLIRILESIRRTSEEAGVAVVTGDTKVVEKGGLSQIIINTSGIGFRSPELDHNFKILESDRTIRRRWLVPENIRPGDKVIITGPIGDHGIAVMSAREGIRFKIDVTSDVQPLNKMMKAALAVGGIADAKDPTRGGLASALNDIAEGAGLGIYIRESLIPVREDVRMAAEFLGLDLLEVGNEGKAIIIASSKTSKDVLDALRSTPQGREAEIIGEVVSDFEGVVLETEVGGKRYVPRPIGDPVPRIC